MDLQQWIKTDRSKFAKKRETIRARLSGQTGILDHIAEENKEDIFYMLMFCLLVPRSDQKLADAATNILRKNDFYAQKIEEKTLSTLLRGKARFHNVEARRIVYARHVFLETSFWDDLKDKFEAYQRADQAGKVRTRNRILLTTRTWLDSKIDGMSMKGASHFMRNVGMRGLAVLDAQVRQAVKDRFDMGNPGDPMSRDEYYLMEQKVKEYAEETGIVLDELGLLWSNSSK